MIGLGQEVRKVLVRALAQGHFLPEIRSQVSVRLGDGGISGLGEVSKGTSRATGRSVAILNTGHSQQLLGNGSRHNAGTTGSRNETHGHGTAFSSYLQDVKKR